jgi:hypothetical protein
MAKLKGYLEKKMIPEIHLSRLMDQAKHLAQLAKQVDDYSELVYEATKLEQRIKEYEESR